MGNVFETNADGVLLYAPCAHEVEKHTGRSGKRHPNKRHDESMRDESQLSARAGK